MINIRELIKKVMKCLTKILKYIIIQVASFINNVFNNSLYGAESIKGIKLKGNTFVRAISLPYAIIKYFVYCFFVSGFSEVFFRELYDKIPSSRFLQISNRILRIIIGIIALIITNKYAENLSLGYAYLFLIVQYIPISVLMFEFKTTIILLFDDVELYNYMISLFLDTFLVLTIWKIPAALIEASLLGIYAAVWFSLLISGRFFRNIYYISIKLRRIIKNPTNRISKLLGFLSVVFGLLVSIVQVIQLFKSFIS